MDLSTNSSMISPLRRMTYNYKNISVSLILDHEEYRIISRYCRATKGLAYLENVVRFNPEEERNEQPIALKQSE